MLRATRPETGEEFARILRLAEDLRQAGTPSFSDLSGSERKRLEKNPVNSLNRVVRINFIRTNAAASDGAPPRRINNHFFNVIARHASKNLTVLLTTHSCGIRGVKRNLNDEKGCFSQP